ncbi:hypothetical protein ZWY2020_000069 [Hordeum vulgare]|nr:hypothetical protein ZWY2020_000069 [Hordeum vulgare]
MGCIPSRAASRSATPALTPTPTRKSTPALTPTPTPGPWTGLPPQLLHDVSGRLQHASDFVRFHAVCKPWRDAGALLSRPTCLPWVLTPCEDQMLHSIVDFHHPLGTPHEGFDHRDIILVEPTGASRTNNSNWVASADGTATWLFVARPQQRLIDIFTGAFKPLPPLPDDERKSMKNLRGVVYGDGTVLLYNFIKSFPSHSFTAAILCPGNATWTIMTKGLKLFEQPYAMYHDNKVLVLDGDSLWCFMMKTEFEANGTDVTGDELESRWDLDKDIDYLHECSYILESHGELLLASVQKKRSLSRYACSNPAPMLRVTLRTMQKEPASGKMQWVEKDGRNLGDHVLFLGSPASLAMKLDEGGACAYFVYWGGVFRYSFVDGQAKAVKWLRPECRSHEACVWLRPSLSFTPIKEVKERLEARKNMKREYFPVQMDKM